MPTTSVVMPSADGAALGKYGALPVSLYTGIPSISVPIYTISIKGMQVPISLSYHAGGHKVDELASSVGLGWSLSYGGSIVQSVNGRPDEENGGWLQGYPWSATMPQDMTQLQKTWDPFSFYENDNQYHFMKDLAANQFETQPDLFIVNMNGNSFKYFMDKSANAFTVPYTDVSVDHVSHTIYDRDGNTFAFGATDGATTFYEMNGYFNPDGSNQPTNYTVPTRFPSTITSKFGETLTYEYESDSYTFYNQPSEVRYVNYPNQNGSCNLPQNTSTGSHTLATGLRVKKITASNGITVNFYYAYSRLDIPGTEALTSIVVKDPDGGVLKTITLAYDHFATTGTSSVTADNYRLKLLSVQKAGEPAYTFDYNTTTNLPYRLSRGQDHWGYYNGGGNTTLFPIDFYNGFLLGGNRESNPLYTQANMLTKITYPEGGNTSFEFEQNATTSNSYIPTVHNYSLAALSNSTVTQAFTLTTVNDHVMVNYKAQAVEGFFLNPNTNQMESTRVSLKTSDGTLIKNFLGTSGGYIRLDHTLAPGSYYLEIAYDGSDTGNDAFCNVSYEDGTTLSTIPNYLGGLRVKSITNSPIDGLPITKHYEYLASAATAAPKYTFDNMTESHLIDPDTYVDCTQLAQSNNSSSSISLGAGSAVVYTEINEYTDSKTKGYTNSRFTFVGDNARQLSPDYPNVPPITYDWTDGLPMQTINYAYNPLTSSYYPISRVNNEYKLNYGASATGLPHEAKVKGAVVSMYKFPIPGGRLDITNPPRAAEFKVSYFYLYQSWSYPTKKTEYTYTDPADTTKKLIGQETYFYESANHIQPTRTEILKSDGRKYKILTSYAFDMYTISTNAPVEKRILVNDGDTDQLLSAELTTYKNNEVAALPDSYYSFKLQSPTTASSLAPFTGSTIDSRYRKRASYDYYGNKDVRSTLKDEVSATTYLWSYNHQYPIAEIRNAGYAEVEAVLGALAINTMKGTLNPDKSTIDAFIAPLKIGLPKAQISTSVYTPGVGVISKTDVKGLTTYYEYDAYQRLVNIKDHDGAIVKNYKYNYHSDLYYNTAKTGSFTKNNCTSGSTGSTLSYTVPANTYSATTQAAADALATAALATAGQVYANANGTCTASTVLSYLNWTTPYYTGGPYESNITGLLIKDAGGNTVYAFNQSQLEAGVTIAQGTYTFVFNVYGQALDFETDLGWYRCYVAGDTYYNEFFRTSATSYTLTGVVVSGNTMGINIDKY